jgi:hypothetical protein
MVEVERANFGRAGATAIQFFYVSNSRDDFDKIYIYCSILIPSGNDFRAALGAATRPILKEKVKKGQKTQGQSYRCR